MASSEHTFDLIVVGSGAGGLLAAVRAADAGLSVQVIEKADLIGGTSAVSGGDIWIPCNHDQVASGIEDSLEDAYRYVRACAKGMSSDERVLAYVESAPELGRYLADIGIHYLCVPDYSDYYPTVPGSRPGGRTMDPAGFNAARLGVEALDEIRPTTQVLMGRASINTFDAHVMLTKQRGANWVVAKLLLRYFLDYPWRLKSKRDRRLSAGQALVGGLYAALRKRGGSVLRGTPMRELVVNDGRVEGVVIERDGKPVSLTAKRGVLLACGGFERNQALREKYLPQPTNADWTATPPGGNTGDGITAGASAGGALHLMAHTWGGPTMEVPRYDRYVPILVERSMPGCMVVNAQGKRFLNESGPYPEFQQAMYAEHEAHGGAIPAWIVFDADFRAKYPIGPLMPTVAMPDTKVYKNWWNKVVWKGETLDALAAATGIDAAGLKASAERMGEFARTGKDLDFDRGGNTLDRFYGDVNVAPNPNLAPIAKGPFYAMQLWPGDIGTKGGLLTNHDGQVLDTDGKVIDGLYCTGNCSASPMGPSYPGAGSTLGPAMTFAFRAAAHMAGKPIALEHTEWLHEPSTHEVEPTASA